MPHSSGGGSHGGGFHGGGSHGGGSGNRVSTHYFAGARRYRRHHRSTGRDEYVYATSRPQKTKLSSIIFVGVIGAFFFWVIAYGTHSEAPKKLNSASFYEPAVYDDRDLIDNDEALAATLNEYYAQTGICSVIYTVYDEDWSDVNPYLNTTYADLETYAYCTYVDNFSDEQHFVIVYSVPENDAELVKSGKITVPNYSWEAIQGDDTDLILTEGMFRVFGNKVQKDLEAGLGPGQAFDNAFHFAIEDADSRLKVFSFSNIIGQIKSLFPVLFVAAIIIPMIVIMIRQYIKDKDVDYEEVPLYDRDTDPDPGVSAGAYASTYSSNGGTRSFSTNTRAARGISKVALIFSLVFMIPFVLVGVGMIAGGAVAMASANDEGFGGAILGFGVLWTSIVAIMVGGIIISFVRLLKKNKETFADGSVEAEYSGTEQTGIRRSAVTGNVIHDPGAIPVTPVYPDSDPKRPFVPSNSNSSDAFFPSDSGSSDAFFPSGADPANPFVPLSTDNSGASASSGADPSSPFVPLREQPEYDSRFFESPKSSIEDDDEDYKRMKRRGYE